MKLESVVALVASIGSFSMACMTANTFGIERPAENRSPLARGAHPWRCAARPRALGRVDMSMWPAGQGYKFNEARRRAVSHLALANGSATYAFIIRLVDVQDERGSFRR